MFDRIIYISDKSANVKLVENHDKTINLMNLHLIFEDRDKKVLGEVDDLDGDIVKVRFLGEIVDGRLIGGVLRKPSLDAAVRVIEQSEIPMIVGEEKQGYMELGVSPFYNDFPVYLDVNNFFSNHFAIFGNSGSGKSCGISRLFQNMFHDQNLFPYKANILLFDSSSEYYNAFKNLNFINANYHYRFFSTNETDGVGEKLRLPIWLLNATDLALLLQATSHSQLPIIERMLKLALIFSQEDVDANKYKNHLIAKAIMTILYTNETSPNKRNEIFSILASCSTEQFNLEAPVKGIGYTRKFRECFLIDNNGQFSESVLLTEYVSSFINSEYDNYEPKGGVYYTLDTLEKALNFTLISEGWLRNENTYGDAITIKVRLHSLVIGPCAKYFNVDKYISLESYLSSLLINNGRKYQIVNINLNDVDDDFGKVITKIYSRLVFDFAKGLQDRASIPFHIVVEEAHRYIQNDTDRFLIGYNIFERIAKEGRKYGVILGLISQRPVELSDTVISQCSNFMIFKMNHPVDVDYIRKMVPNISDEIVEKQKTLQSGTCLGFGMAFRIPLIVKMKMPDPAPYSGNCDVVTIWSGNTKKMQKSDENTATNDSVSTVNQQQVVAPQFTNVEIPSVNNLNQGSVASLDNANGDSHSTVDDTLSKLITITGSESNSNINTLDNSFSDVNVNNNNNNISSDKIDDTLSKLITITGSENGNNVNTLDSNFSSINVNDGINLNNNNSNSNNSNNNVLNTVLPELNMADKLDTSVLRVPEQAIDIPNQIQMTNDRPVIVPTIEDRVNAIEGVGSVRVVPPTDNFVNNGSTSLFNLGDD